MEHQDPVPQEPLTPKQPHSHSTAAAKHAKKKRKRRKTLLTILGVFLLVVVLLASIGLFYLNLWRSGQWHPSSELKQVLMSLADSSELMEYARNLKGDLKELAGCLQGQDPDSAEQARSAMQKDIKKIRSYIDSPLFLAVSAAPGVGSEVHSVKELLSILEDADETLIGPYIDQMRANPLTGLNGADGIRVDVLTSYLDFLESILPKAELIMGRLKNVDLSLLDQDGKMSGYIEQLSGLLGTGNSAQEYLPAVRAILGDGSDRLYIFAAQNSSEIRASGGFPGSVGLVRIRDGLLTISDFKSVYLVFQQQTPAAANISDVEEFLFSRRMHLSWDSDFSPDFERVASIWALAYEARNQEKVDGVISGTPAIIQRMLSFLGSVTLSDGTELNGENASRVLGHDIYFKYLGASQQAGAADYVDELFAEAARETMSLLFSQMNARMFADFFTFFLESTADRTMMIWMADEAEQELIRQAGWSAGLNTDPAHPQAGIFFNSTVASKMAWFLNIEPELSEPTKNEDGSLTYDLTVRFANVMTPEERSAASRYILGRTDDITGSLYVFAPAGGHIDEAVSEIGYTVKREVYEGLELGCLLEITITSDSPMVVHFRITTAPGVEAPMGLIVTPTMQEYR